MRAHACCHAGRALPSSSIALEQLREQAAAAVQPAVSMVIAAKQQHAGAVKRLNNLRWQKEVGQFPDFIMKQVPNSSSNLDTYLEKSADIAAVKTAKAAAAAGVKHLRLTLLDSAIAIAEAERAAADEVLQGIRVQAQARLQQPFAKLPAAMVTAPEVFRISRDQDFDYQFNLQAALSNFKARTFACCMSRQCIPSRLSVSCCLIARCLLN
jgi:hypothetical protein